jgi:hypothetical protein
VLVELQVGPGAQTVFPGSVHEGTGEPIRWEEEGDPARVDDIDLQRRVHLLAATCLLARYWPQHGGRHDTALALGGFLARAGVSLPDIKCVVEGITRTVGDTEYRDRRQAAGFKEGKRVFGFPEISKAFGKEVASNIADWIGYQGSRDGAEVGEQLAQFVPVVATPYVWKNPETIQRPAHGQAEQALLVPAL